MAGGYGTAASRKKRRQEAALARRKIERSGWANGAAPYSWIRLYGEPTQEQFARKVEIADKDIAALEQKLG